MKCWWSIWVRSNSSQAACIKNGWSFKQAALLKDCNNWNNSVCISKHCFVFNIIEIVYGNASKIQRSFSLSISIFFILRRYKKIHRWKFYLWAICIFKDLFLLFCYELIWNFIQDCFIELNLFTEYFSHLFHIVPWLGFTEPS